MESTIMPQGGAQNIPQIVHQIGGQLPWSHIKILLDKTICQVDTCLGIVVIIVQTEFGGTQIFNCLINCNILISSQTEVELDMLLKADKTYKDES